MPVMDDGDRIVLRLEVDSGDQPPSGVAPRDRDVAATARAAIDALRRGVVAYTSLAD